jgi:hypothetical protein
MVTAAGSIEGSTRDDVSLVSTERFGMTFGRAIEQPRSHVQ